MSYAVIRQAILDRASLTAVYDYVRYFSAHMLGTHSNGVPVVVAFQYGGGKPGGLLPSGEWCCFLVPRIHYVQRNGEKWAAGTCNDKPLNVIRIVDIAA